MPEETISIGGKKFEVACQPGEESFLQSAAAMLDHEAQALIAQIGRLPEARMLLMAGLMLADKTAGTEDRLREAEDEIDRLRAEITKLREQPRPAAGLGQGGATAEDVAEMLAELAARAESLADRMDERA